MERSSRCKSSQSISAALNATSHARSKLTSELVNAKKSLEDARKSQEESPNSLRTRLANAQSTLTATLGIFMSEAQASQSLNALYQYASASTVTITDLQTQIGSNQGSKDTYQVTSVRLQAQGSSRQLVAFASRIKEASTKSFVINNLGIDGGEGTAKLTMDISLYTSPYASGGQPLATIVPTRTAIPPTATPSPTTPALSAEAQLAQRLDGLWGAKDWVQVIGLIEQIRAINPNYDRMTDKLYAAHVNYGNQLVTEGKMEEAKAEFNKALVIRPDGGEAIAALRQLSVKTPTPTPQYIIYVVRAGDTLYSIARRYGTTAQAIAAANGLTNYNIRVGQQLLIPNR